MLLGIYTALKFSHKNKIILDNDYYSIIKHMKDSKLPFNIKKFFTVKQLDKILSFMLKDKKNKSEKINLILLKNIGSPIINKVYNKNILRLFLSKELVN